MGAGTKPGISQSWAVSSQGRQGAEGSNATRSWTNWQVECPGSPEEPAIAEQLTCYHRHTTD